MEVFITRDANDSINGVRRTGRVFVTGPHFGDAYSSTEAKSKASTFSEAEAARLIASGYWSNCRPAIEPYPPFYPVYAGTARLDVVYAELGQTRDADVEVN